VHSTYEAGPKSVVVAEAPEPSPTGHSRLLRLLALLFVGRVVIQLVQLVRPVEALPRFEEWQSGALPYGVLLVLQLAIVAGHFRVIRAVSRGERLLGPAWRRSIFAFAVFYLAVMAFRLIAGLTFAASGGWLDAGLPTIFHLVLAAFLIVWIHHESVGSQGMASRALFYPVVSIGACLAFVLLDRSGAPTMVAAYGPILLAAILITVAERRIPYRAAWAPDRGTVTTDMAFMAVVQMVVPAFAAVAFALCASAVAQSVWEVGHVWPHHLPDVVQVALVLVAADFFRYWQHRAMHNVPILWRLHAVHHSPDRLYWLNVGRFHPLEEVLQSLVETLPFVILGIDPTVLAGYFVFYAVNGFFQHSNCDVRLGPLNQLVAGPELHRWHHAAEIRDANHNFGNKLIVWDTLFRTRYLPADREVGELGIRGLTYPTTFAGQLAAPFRRAVAS